MVMHIQRAHHYVVVVMFAVVGVAACVVNHFGTMFFLVAGGGGGDIGGQPNVSSQAQWATEVTSSWRRMCPTGPICDWNLINCVSIYVFVSVFAFVCLSVSVSVSHCLSVSLFGGVLVPVLTRAPAAAIIR
jgi:hypothetical protein